ncbi:MAG: acyltransferase domain-containing protein, partial [Actinopolymorphaceae bacterium]
GLPAEDDLPPVLLDLAVPHEDIDELIALRTVLLTDPDLRWLLTSCTSALVQGVGSIDQQLDLPLLPEDLGAVGRYFYVLVFVAALPHAQAHHRERGIPPDISRRTLADLGRNMAVHRRRRGTGGLHVPFWLKNHFRGELYQLGRLQFQRARLGNRTGQALRASGLSLGRGDPCLAVHIPEFSGRLTPRPCDQSLALARDFFPRHFPDEEYTVAACYSWLLDPQLKEYLPVDANIVRFQERFRTAYEVREVNDADTLTFVFGDPDISWDTLPRRTTLERAIGDHLRSGRHWHGGNGWMTL